MAVLHQHRFGDPDGEPLFAVHGITAHGRRYRRLGEEGWPERHTVAVDLRGHGRSLSDGPWSIAQHVSDLEDTLDALGWGQVDVIGHSYGGPITMELLRRAPERVRRLVLLDPAFGFDGAAATESALRTIADPGFASVEDATIARNAGLGEGIHPAVPEEVAEHLVAGVDGRFRWRYHKPAVITGWGEVCYPLPAQAPMADVLVVVADRADFVTAEVEAGLRALFGDALTVVHLDSGHLVYWEAFEATAAAVRAFLAGQPSVA